MNADDDTFREIPSREDIGICPSLCNLNNKIIILIGGNNSEKVFTFDVSSDEFEFVGKMNSIRKGAYIIHYNTIVYICGGVNQDNDNTIEVEYFELNKHYENKTLTFKNSYLLRKINPLCFEIESGVFYVCGGYCLFDKTDTCCFVETEKPNVQIRNILLPKPYSSFNPNNLYYKGNHYFYGEDENEIYEFSSFDYSFTIIKKEDIIFN